MASIAVIGAGLAGLTLARELSEKHDVKIFEKSRGAGGRMSTRRAEPWFFDHGAQYFKAKTARFQAFIKPMLDSGLVVPWEGEIAEFSAGVFTGEGSLSSGEPRYVGAPGMNAVPKYLATGLDLQANTRVSMIQRSDGWTLFDDHAQSLGDFDWVVSAIPAEQATAILPPEFKGYERISSVRMRGNYTLMLGFEEPISFCHTAAKVKGYDIGWMAVNSNKLGRDGGYSLVIQSTPEFADKHIDGDRSWVMNHLIEQASELVYLDLSIAPHKVIHGWKYAGIEPQAGSSHHLDTDLQLASCGDWHIEGKVEAAVTSGLDLADAMLKAIDEY